MRDYRKRKRSALTLREAVALKFGPDYAPDESETAAIVADLEAEVARLKRELASRPVGPAFNSRPFTPVPKGK
jgi:hypothetical protein